MAKKVGKKTAQKPAKKSTKTVAKTVTKKIAKKTAAKAPKKVVKKPAQNSAKPAAKKNVLKTAKKAASKSQPKKNVKQKASATPLISAKKPQSASSVKMKKLDLTKLVTPLDDRLLVQLSGTDKMTAGGLYIPDTVSDVSGNLQGTVIAIGRGHVSKKGHLRKMDVQIGDKVVFSEYTGSKINIENEDLIILREAEVMGVISK